MQRVAGYAAYLLCAAGLHNADRVADKCGRCQRQACGEQGKKERRIREKNVPIPRLR